jgi:hypothetical protein
VVVLVAFWSVELAGACVFWSVVLIDELDDAELSCGTVLEEAGAELLPAWLLELEFELLISLLLELAGAVAEEPEAEELGVVVVEGAAVGFDWLEV